MHVRVEQTVPGVVPRDAARWWSDFREGRADHAFVPGNERRIVERGASHVTMTERTRWLGITVFRESTTAWPRETEVGFAGQNGLAVFQGTYCFEPASEGTRIVLDANIRLRGGLAWTDVAAKPLAEVILRADLRAHAKDMRREVIPH